MRVAFLFNSEIAALSPGTYNLPCENALFRAMKGIQASRRHYVISTGDLIGWRKTEDGLGVLTSALFDETINWTTLSAGEFQEASRRFVIWIAVVDGLDQRAALHIEHQMRSFDAYVGAIQVRLSNKVHWVVFEENIGTKFRVVGDTLRVMHDPPQITEDALLYAQQTADHWAGSKIWSNISLENRGLRGTIFDETRDYNYARWNDELEELLSGHLAAVANEVLLRGDAYDQQLQETLRSALMSFERAETRDDLATVALGCRRVLERLADALYPASTIDPSLGKDKYRNRLLQYVKESGTPKMNAIVLAAETDIESRIRKLDSMNNSGLHGITAIPHVEIQRLLISIITLVYDILMIKAVPEENSDMPQRESALKLMKEWLNSDEEL
jgi:hypothetical protein